MDDFKRLSSARCSVGGYKCPCCGPSPGKERVKLRRIVRRSFRQITRRETDFAIVEGI